MTQHSFAQLSSCFVVQNKISDCVVKVCRTLEAAEKFLSETYSEVENVGDGHYMIRGHAVDPLVFSIEEFEIE